MQRIVQVGLGALGRRVAAELVERGFVLEAAVDPADELRGLSLAEIAPGASPEHTVAATLDDVALDSIDAALVTTTSSLSTCADTFRALLARGLAVVSSCEQLAWPWLRNAPLARELDALAREHGGRLLGTGINPGFLMDAWPLRISAVCRTIERVVVTRTQDAAKRRIPFQRKIGAGLTRDELERGLATGELGHVGLGESLHLLAHGLGLTLEQWEERAEPVIAERDLESGLGPIAPGRCAGVQQVARGHGGGVELELVFRAAIGEPDPTDRIVISGVPSLEITCAGGVAGDIATSAVLVNAIRPLLEAPPGLHTAVSVPVRYTAGR